MTRAQLDALLAGYPEPDGPHRLIHHDIGLSGTVYGEPRKVVLLRPYAAGHADEYVVAAGPDNRAQLAVQARCLHPLDSTLAERITSATAGRELS